ncbi:hypothetical protein [Lichenifustis flavocetrariae]|uniref:Uncharacterized protein n=1 Tax=Lichenifustis flavocetrariae TaxID=2949735 RepID=A0AA41Z464_9HYPH|nr:hypothetical protein [Lichenifustis flavocetrariae]MCW6510015.1 hypothetical protein [Lichenifustis flavocetrariae]
MDLRPHRPAGVDRAAARSRPVPSRLVDDPDELAALAEIEEATSARLNAEERGRGGLPAGELVHGVPHARFINASFARWKPQAPKSFNGTDRGAWSAVLATEICIAEVGFHLTQALAEAGGLQCCIDYAKLFASMAGEFLDLLEICTTGAEAGLTGWAGLDPLAQGAH